MKTQDEYFMKNAELSTEFSKYVLEHPELDELLNEDRVVIFLPAFDQSLKEFNLKMGKDIEAEGGSVLYVKIKEVYPKVSSRLAGVEVG